MSEPAPPTPGEASALSADDLLAAITTATEVAIFVKDDGGRYQFVNRKLASLWRRPVSEILGRTDRELFPLAIARELREHDLQVMETRSPLEIEESVEFGGREQIYLSSKVPLFDADGKVLGVCGTAIQITDRKEAEARLRESEELFRSLADSVPVLIWMSGPDKAGEFFNKTWLDFTGRRLDEELGSGWLEGVHPDDGAAMDECARAFDERRPFEARFRLRRGDGEYRWMLDTGVPRQHADGQFSGFIGSCVDVTSQTGMETALREQARALVAGHERKDEFLAMLGHELRNPMAPLGNVLELFQSRRAELDESLGGALDIAQRQFSHMRRMVDDLLDMARIQRGRIRLEKIPLPLSDAVECAVSSIRSELDARDVRLEVDLPDSSPIVDGDEARLAQVVSNLLHNALKYTPDPGVISLRVEEEGDSVVLAIRDTGVGIEQEELEEIFELFHQTDQPLDRQSGGLGIGLALARRIIRLHGGEVFARSDGKNQGSEFRVRLPRSDARPDSGSGEAVGTAQVPRRVLLVEDHADSADSLRTLLTLHGHEVEIARDGVAGVEAYEALLPDVVLLDIGLPRLDGFGVAKQIRDHPGRQPVLVALTGYGQESAVRRAGHSGFDHHLLKPVDLKALLEIVRSAPRGAAGQAVLASSGPGAGSPSRG